MAKYDSPRKSQSARLTAHSLTPGLRYVPSVCRSVLEEDSFEELDEEATNAMSAVESPPCAWEMALHGLEDDFDDPLPVPELAPEEETGIVARPPMPAMPQTMPAPAMPQTMRAPTPVITHSAKPPRSKPPLDPLAMLEAATIRNVPSTRR